MSYVFDSSAIFKTIKEENLDHLVGNYTVELARYELGNTLWKERTLHRKLSSDELKRLTRLIREVLGVMQVLGINSHEEEILDTAEKLKITFYDAAYVFYAKEKNLPLVTEDEKIIDKTRTYIKSIRTQDLRNL